MCLWAGKNFEFRGCCLFKGEGSSRFLSEFIRYFGRIEGGGRF